jgi:DNA repair exonuclease SbcCD ATPase subunit
MTIAELQKKSNQIEGFVLAFKSREANLQKEIKAIKESIDVDTKASSVLKHLLDHMVKNEIEKMAGLITYGLKTIFDDQNLTFVPIIAKKNEKMHIELNTRRDNIEGDMNSFGGSIAVIESFLLRILCLLKLNLAKFMLLDETFAPVSEEYISNTSKMVSEISKKLGIDVLLVTHQKSFMDNADHVYKASESINGLIMEKMK